MKKMDAMKFHAGIKLRIYPSDEQKRLIAVNDGAQRYVYNHLVATNNEIYMMSKSAAVVPCYRQRLEYLKSVRSDSSAIENMAPFLYSTDVDCQTIANAKANYQAAWANMKERHTGVPAFHKKSYEQSYQTNNHYAKDKNGMYRCNIRIEDKTHIILPKLGRIRIAGSKKRILQLIERSQAQKEVTVRDALGTVTRLIDADDFIRIGTACISRDSCGDYYVSLQLASDKPFRECFPASTNAVGIDMNLSNFCTDSDCNVTDTPHFRRKMQPKIAKQQRVVSRRAECAKKENRPLAGSKNYQKARLKLAKQLKHSGNQRTAFIENLSHDYVEN